MKTRQLRSFLEEFLALEGVPADRVGDNLLVVRPPKKFATAIGAQERVLAFNVKGLQEDPHSELATVGNPVFDRILELARATGRAGERYVPAGAVPRKLPDPAEHFRFLPAGTAPGAAVPTYAPLYFMTFRVEYSLEELPDELEVIAVDSVNHQTLPQMPEMVDYWEGLDREPAAGRTPRPAYPIRPEAIRAALRLLEKRLRKRLSKIRRDADGHLDIETNNIKAYYTQLIEETRNAGKRWVLPAGGREERIRLLQLDWKRRVEEAQQYWRPRLHLTLSAVASVQIPRIGFPVADAAAPKGKRRAAAPESWVFWDEETRGFLDPPCARCGNPTQRELTPFEGAFLCGRCGAAAAVSRAIAKETSPAKGRTRVFSKDGPAAREDGDDGLP